MTAASVDLSFASRLINRVLAIKPLAALAKHQARQMMIKRAESIGVYWTKEVEALRARDWKRDFAQVHAPNLQYPEYYVRSFHAYEQGNLDWEPALEVEVAAYAVHARIWKDAGAEGDPRLRQSYHAVLKAHLPHDPEAILDLGCSVGMSTFALQAVYPHAKLTGVDLSPYFLAVANYRTQQRSQGVEEQGSQERKAGVASQNFSPPSSSLIPPPSSFFTPPTWVHAAAEATGLADASFDLVSACLVFHELPQRAAIAILKEARRLLRPGGHLAIMDMNPQSEVFVKMPPYILTLLKSTEPYLDEYFALNLEQAIVEAGFEQPTVTSNSPRHRTLIAQVRNLHDIA